MNLKQLEAFVEVAQSGSFSKAAKKLFLTQPTISAHIASLEKELDDLTINGEEFDFKSLFGVENKD